MSPRRFLFHENISETNLIKFCIHAEQVSAPLPSPFPHLPTVPYLRSIFCLFSEKKWKKSLNAGGIKRRIEQHLNATIKYLIKIYNTLLCSPAQPDLQNLYLVITSKPMHLTQYVHGNEIHLSVLWYWFRRGSDSDTMLI